MGFRESCLASLLCAPQLWNAGLAPYMRAVSSPSTQPDFVCRTGPVPAGLRYQRDAITAAEERDLVAAMAGLPFKELEFQRFLAKRRVVSFGWRYDFNGGGLTKAEPVPAFLFPARRRQRGSPG